MHPVSVLLSVENIPERKDVMRKLFVIGVIVLMVSMLAVPTAHASPREGFYMEKVCPSLDNPNACDIHSAATPIN